MALVRMSRVTRLEALFISSKFHIHGIYVPLSVLERRFDSAELEDQSQSDHGIGCHSSHQPQPNSKFSTNRTNSGQDKVSLRDVGLLLWPVRSSCVATAQRPSDQHRADECRTRRNIKDHGDEPITGKDKVSSDKERVHHEDDDSAGGDPDWEVSE